jgi:hypothetical protein
MKFLAAVLAFVAVVSAQDASFNTDGVNNWAILGYPNNFEVVKGGGNAYGQFHVDAAIQPDVTPVNMRRACFKLMAKAGSPAIGNTNFYAITYNGAEAAAPKPTKSDFGFGFTLSSSTRSGSGVFDWTPTVNASMTAYTWPMGVAVYAEVGACTACSKTSELSVTGVIGWTSAASCTSTGASITWTSFVAVDDRNTWEFDAVGTGYQQPPIWLKSADVSRPVFFFTQPQAGSTNSMTIAVHKVLVARPADPTTLSQQSADVKGLPLGPARNGNFRSGGVTLESSAWMIDAWVTRGGTWRLAVGFGHEPAAAAGLVPSFILAALLAAVALLF